MSFSSPYWRISSGAHGCSVGRCAGWIAGHWHARLRGLREPEVHHPAGLRVLHRGRRVREHAGCCHLRQRRQLCVAVGGGAGHPARHAVHRVKSVGADFTSGRSAPVFAEKTQASRKKSAQSPLTNRFPCATISTFEAEACPSLTLRGVCCRVHRLFPFQAD